MAAKCQAASSQRLRRANFIPSATYPFTVGCFVRVPSVTSTGLVTLWSICDTGTTNNYFELLQQDADIGMGVAAGGAPSVVGIPSILSANVWTYVLFRAVSATFRRLIAWRMDGSYSAVSDTASGTPTGIDTIALGAREASTPTQFSNVDIAEWWLADIDAYVTNADDVAFVYNLWINGPFSIPHIAERIVEYRSLRSMLSAGDMTQTYASRLIPGVWENVNGVTCTTHPPLPYYHRAPAEPRSLLII